MIACGFCGFEFDEAEAQKACRNCPMSGLFDLAQACPVLLRPSRFAGRREERERRRTGGCGLVRCPRCGYEAPPEPRWIRRVRKWVHK